ncbi:MAG TPA: hypothetical protein VGM39_02295 [Kofleriaceae bacterium]
MKLWVVLLPLAGCAVQSTCPTGTTLVAHEDHAGRTELCAQRDPDSASVPTVGPTFDSQIALNKPPPMPGGVEGPFTQWFPSGKVAAHGRYIVDGGQSVPEGLWAFWYPDGKRQVYGTYHLGAPAGCFVALDEDGTIGVGTVHGSLLKEEACDPPPDNEIAIIEGKVRDPQVYPWADVDLRVFAGPNHLGVENKMQSSPHPDATFATEASIRMRFGQLRIGPIVGARFTNASEGTAFYGGGSVGWELPKFHPRLDSEITAELALDHIEPSPAILMGFNQAFADVSFWRPLAAVQANLVLALSPGLSVLVGLRAEDTFAHDVDTDLRYCDPHGHCEMMKETWSVGGLSYGLNAGIRVMLF